MKKLTYLFALAGLLGMSSCNDYLDIVPKGNKIPTTLADYEALLRNEYTISQTPVTNALYLLNDQYMTKSSLGSPTLNTANYLWDENADRITLNNSDEGTYYYLYGGISSCNLIVENAPTATESTEEERNEALKRHVQSVKQHVNELARKDYSAYIKPPRQSLNYVIMFVPNESALQLALQSEATLWHDAFERGVFITSEQNLMAALRMIQIAWTQVQQARNQEAIFDTARMLLDRVADFIKYFDEMGQKLQDAHSFYIKSANKLRDGKQSVVGGANKLIRLGAKTSSNKNLPETNDSGIPSQSENAAFQAD